MLVKQDQISPCEVELEIEVEAEKVSSMVEQTYTELGKSTAVPGFRKGKAPREILESFLDRDRIYDRAADKLMIQAYSEALGETKLDPFRPAGVELVKLQAGEPMLFKARVPLAPKVELGDYVGLEIERRVPPVRDEDVDAEVRRLVEGRTPMTQITDRELREGDTAVVDIGHDEEPDEEPEREVFRIGENLPGFDEGVTGMKIDEERSVQINYPDDYSNEDLRGKTKNYRVRLLEMHTKILPELTDEWVKANLAPETEEGKEPPADVVDTVEKLRARMRGAMERAARDYADSAVRGDVVSRVVEGSKVCFPEVMVAEGVDRRLGDLRESLSKRKATLEDYLEYRDETLDQLNDRYAEETREVLTTLLVFREIIEREGIKVEKEDTDAMIREMAEERGVPVESIRAYLDSTDSHGLVENRVSRKKVVDFLVHASNIKNVAG